jgi:hypothetical protein
LRCLPKEILQNPIRRSRHVEWKAITSNKRL